MQLGTPIEFQFNELGELTGTTWAGTFIVRPVLSFGGLAQADAERRRFLGNPENELGVSEEVKNISVMLSQIKARIVEAPSWVKESGYLAEFIDANVLISLFTKCMDIENEYRTRLSKKATEVLKDMKTDSK